MADIIFNHFAVDLQRQSMNLCNRFYDKGCCTKWIHNLDIQEPECLKLFVAKSLGYGIVVGASLVKLPQVFKIIGAKSGVGIALFGVLLELMAITLNACYSFRNDFPFSAWGEAVFLAVETALIAFLLMWFAGSKIKATLFILMYSGLTYILTHPTMIPLESDLWSSVLPLAVTGKLIQVSKNYRAQHTGQLSAITAWAILAGSVIRVFTTIQETGDTLTATTFAFAATVNAVIALQVLYYWKSTQRFMEKSKEKKAN